MTNKEALRILHCPSAYLTDEDSEFAHTIPMFSKAYGQAIAVAFKSLEAWEKVKAEIIENSIKDYEYHGCGIDELIIETNEVLRILDKYKAESEVEHDT